MTVRATRPSTLEWLDSLPLDWDERELGRETWVRARLGWKGLTADEYVDDGIPLLATPDIKQAKIDFQGANKISAERYEESPEIMLSNGDVLLTKDGSTIGTVNVVRDLPGPATVNGSIAVLTPIGDLDGRYLYWFIASRYAQATFDRLRGGMGVPHLFQRDINRIRIPFPPKSEQGAIADYLDRETAQIDTLIAEQEQIIALLRERREAVISHAVTKGLGARCPLLASGITWLGDIPATWTVRALRRCGHLLTGSTPPTGEGGHYAEAPNQRPWVRPQDLTADTQASAWLTPEGWRHVRPVPAGTVLVGCIAYSLGSVGHTRVETTTNQQITSIVPKEDGRYLYYVMLAARDELWASSHMNRVPILNNERLGAIRIPVPPIGEQRLIADYLDEQTAKIDTLIGESERLIELGKERRSALITAAVTGQLDVSERAA